ncbi:helix-turn-helix transcriptional regulator [Streptomyces sp. NPDC057889]|uniref:helix-turn-helix transcriptional regulator n=1 Tax=unclassified Streptomyces TaxID=2593676 RepID=UPI003694565E
MPSSPFITAGEIVEEFRASRSRLSEWVRDRDTTGFPPVHPTEGRRQVFERDAVIAWFSARAALRSTPLPADAAQGNPDELLSAAEVAQLLGYQHATTVHAYLQDRPGYFPEPDHTGPLSNHPRKAGRPNTLWWKRRTILDWAAQRPGKGNARPKTRTPHPAQGPAPTATAGHDDDLLTAAQVAPLLGYSTTASFTSALAQGRIPQLTQPDAHTNSGRGRPRRLWRRHRIIGAAIVRNWPPPRPEIAACTHLDTSGNS